MLGVPFCIFQHCNFDNLIIVCLQNLTTRMSKVGAISKAQKAQNIFLEKNEIFEFFPKKVAQCRKNPKGDPLGTSGFVGFLEKVKNERGTLCIMFASLPRPDLALVGVSGLFLKSGPISVRIVV